MKREVNNIYTSIDIGSNEIKMVVATYLENDIFQIKQTASVVSTSVNCGVIIDSESFYQDIYKLTKPYRKQIGNIVVNISAPNMRSMIVKNGISTKGKIDENTILHAIKSCKDYASATEQGMQNFFYVRNFTLDHSRNSLAPIDEKAKYLEVDYNLISIDDDIIKNIYNIFGKLGLHILAVIPSPVALAKFVLTPEQKRSGVCLLDIGKQTTDMIVYENNAIKHIEILDFGGSVIDENIAYHYDCNLVEAKRLKESYGFINIDNREEEQFIDFTQAQSQKFLSNYQLAEVIEHSVKQFLNNVKLTLKNNEITSPKNGFVITGYGSNITQFREFARIVLKNKVNNLILDDDFLKTKIKAESFKKLNNYQLSLAVLTYNEDIFYKEQQFKHSNSFFGSVKQKLGILEK